MGCIIPTHADPYECRVMRSHCAPSGSRTADRTDTRLAAVVAALASFGASVIHFSVAPGHWHEWAPAGLFFVGVASLQLVWGGVTLWAPNARVMGAGIMANLGLMALWGVSRLWGLPIGPAAGAPESVSAAGVLAATLEGLIVVSSAWSLLPRERVALFPATSYRLALAGAAAVVVALMAPGAAVGLGHTHGGPAHGGDERHHDTPAPDLEQATPGPSESTATRTPAASPTGHHHSDPHS